MPQISPTLMEADSGLFDLASLIDHSTAVSTDCKLSTFHDQLRAHPHDFVGVVSENGRLEGVVSRKEITELLSGRYGYPLFSKRHAGEFMMKAPLVVSEDTPLLELLKKALTERQGATFHEDVALVSRGHRYLGMISARNLVLQQWRLMLEHSDEARQNRQLLNSRSEELDQSVSELWRSQGRYQILFENDALGIAMVDQFGKIEEANQRLKHLMGWDRNDFDPAGIDLLSLVDVSQQQAMTDLLNIEQAVAKEFLVSTSLSEEPRLFQIYADRVRQTGQLALLIDDITARRELERNAAHSEKSIVLDSLAGGVAHELNNRLTPVMGYAQLLSSSGDRMSESEKQDALDIVQTAVTDASQLIRQLLALSRPPASEMTYSDLGETVRQSMNMLRFELREANCRLELQLCEGATPVHLDPSQFRQILINLVLNARDALEGCEKKSITVRVTRDGEWARMDISDTGCGIPSEKLETIFDPFYTTKESEKGNGLGLSVCQSIAKLHGGKIEATSTEGSGATFSVLLPLLFVSSAPAAEQLQDQLPAAPEKPTNRRLRVLVVDDEDFVATFLSRALEREAEFEPEIASNGRHAVDKLISDTGYDLVVSDVRMPEMDGFALFEWIQENRPDLVTRFLFITGDAGGGALNQKLDLLPVPIVRKPFQIADLTQQCFSLAENRLALEVEEEPVAMLVS